MPDPTKQTLSATQVPGLFGQSPYVTPWMLYHWAKNSMSLDIPETTRMSWGKKLQHVIIAGAAEQLRLEIREADEYRRHLPDRIGYTTDADIYDPALGLGAVEAKNVDARVYKTEWTEEAAPPHIELQLQTQIMVLDAIRGGCKWGIIPVLVGGNELIIHRRLPNPEQQALIRKEVAQFWLDVEQGREPAPFGSPREVPGLIQMYDASRQPGKVEVVSTDEAHEIVRDYEYHKAQRLEQEKLEEALKIKIRGMAKDAEILNVPGYEVTLKTIKIAARTQQVKAHTQTRIGIREVDL
jgi:predicted phage-related endonuclease